MGTATQPSLSRQPHRMQGVALPAAAGWTRPAQGAVPASPLASQHHDLCAGNMGGKSCSAAAAAAACTFCPQTVLARPCSAAHTAAGHTQQLQLLLQGTASCQGNTHWRTCKRSCTTQQQTLKPRTAKQEWQTAASYLVVCRRQVAFNGLIAMSTPSHAKQG